MKPVSMAIIVLVGISCATTGTRIDPSIMNRLTEGVSTRTDAEKLLGPPSSESKGEASSILLWMYAHKGLTGGRETTIVQLVFDAKGILVQKKLFGTHAKY